MKNSFNLNEEEKNRIRGLHLQESKDKRITTILNEQDSGPTEKDREELIKCLGTYKIDSSTMNKVVSTTEESIKRSQEKYPDLNVHRMWMIKVLSDLQLSNWSGDKPEWIEELTKHVSCERQKGGGQEPNRKAEREQSCIYKIISRFPQVIKRFEGMC